MDTGPRLALKGTNKVHVRSGLVSGPLLLVLVASSEGEGLRLFLFCFWLELRTIGSVKFSRTE